MTLSRPGRPLASASWRSFVKRPSRWLPGVSVGDRASGLSACSDIVVLRPGLDECCVARCRGVLSDRR